jgi:hypothetical protein
MIGFRDTSPGNAAAPGAPSTEKALFNLAANLT